MNPKVLVLIGFMALSIVFIAIAVALPHGTLYVVPKLILMALAVLFDVLAFASRYYTFLILPFARQRKKNIVISDQTPYWLSSTGESIIRREAQDFIATVYINIPIYVSASEMTDEEKARFTMQVSRLVGLSKEPVRFTAELYLMNKDSYIQKLKDTISRIEDDEAKLVEQKKESPELEHLRGELSMWRKMLDNVSSYTSYELGTFAAVSARGVKESEAISFAQQRARELMSGIGTVLGVSPNIVVGNEILKYVEPEYLIPYSTITEQIARIVRQEV
ncbi:MAG: hypothetical protein ABSE71_05405 [Candidatus Micrarchaeaceae archaeon]|jgi:hypothetical protein